MGRAFAYFLEGRLDVILYRSNFFTSIFAARQYISHNKVLINGLVVNKPSYIVSLHDVITLRNIETLYISLKERLKSRSILVNHPSYLEVNYKIGAISLVMLPDVKSVPFPFFMNLENFSHNFFR
jgi:small subunit ribosomal protein S4